MNRLDHSALEASLQRAISRGWAAFKREFPDDEVYGLGLYTSPSATYVGMTIFSRDGLTEVANGYANRSGRDERAESAMLRWSPCDSPYHMWRRDLFEEAQAILDAGPDLFEDSTDWDDRVTGALDTFVRSMKQLDESGVFGDSRAGMVLCLWMGDQSDEDRIDYASRLNPRDTWSVFSEELEACIEAWNTRDG